jgi:hypothetical protein
MPVCGGQPVVMHVYRRENLKLLVKIQDVEKKLSFDD